MQPSIDVFRKSCSANVQQIYMRTPACGTVILIKLQSNFLEITLRHGYSSVNFLHIFITSFPKNTSGGLLLFFPMCPFDLLWFIRKVCFFGILSEVQNGTFRRNDWSSHQRCSSKFRKLTGKHLCQSFFFIKIAGLRPEASTLLKTETLPLVFSCEFCEIFKNTVLTEQLRMTSSEMGQV